jgi:hypothetical protein
MFRKVAQMSVALFFTISSHQRVRGLRDDTLRIAELDNLQRDQEGDVPSHTRQARDDAFQQSKGDRNRPSISQWRMSELG